MSRRERRAHPENEIEDRVLPGQRLPGVMLAAGRGARFYEATGQNKLLVCVGGEPVVRRSVRAMLSAPSVDPVLLVVGHEWERVLGALGDLRRHPKLRVVRNERWAEGLSSSLQTALQHLPDGAPGFVVLPGDMPFMTPQLVERVARRFLETGRACYPVHRGRKGHPTALPRELFPALRKLEGDVGAQALLRRGAIGIEIELKTAEEALTQRDVDVPDDLPAPNVGS